MTMPDSLARRQAADVVVQQAPPGTVARHAQQQLEEAFAVGAISLAEYDRIYAYVKAIVEKGGRSPDHQNWFVGKAAHVLSGYEATHNRIIHDAWTDIIQNRPQEIVTTIYQDKPFLKRLTGR
jgi:hypothetical protein